MSRANNLQRLGHWLLKIRHADDDSRRRGRLGVIFCLAMIAMDVLAIPIALLQRSPALALIPIAAGLVLFVGTIALIRNGHIVSGTVLFTGSLIVLILINMPGRATVSVTPFYLLLPLLAAGILLPPRHIWTIWGATIAALFLTISVMPNQPLADATTRATVIGAVLLLSIAALVGFLGARSSSSALTELRQARNELEASWATLAAAKETLEQRVVERTANLEVALATQHAQATALAQSLAAQQQLNELITALSVPIIPLREDVLVVPLVGNLDTARTQQVLQDMLRQIEQRRAHTIFIDVTGIAVVDTSLAEALLQATSAARLLGANSILTGVRPAMAQALVGLGVDLQQVHTVASLADGLATLR